MQGILGCSLSILCHLRSEIILSIELWDNRICHVLSLASSITHKRNTKAFLSLLPLNWSLKSVAVALSHSNCLKTALRLSLRTPFACQFWIPA